MAHFKRKKTKRSVRCTMCTEYRWMGNSKGRKRSELSARRDPQKIAAAIRDETA